MTQDEIPDRNGGGRAEGGSPPPTPVRGDPSAPAPLPTPVRSLMAAPAADGGGAAEATPEPEGDATVEVDGRVWTVRVVGRSLGGPSAAPVSLLLLGFFQDPDAQAPQRETLVAGRTLGALSSEQLEAALGASREPPAPGARKPLFPEIVTKGDRRDG